MDINLWRAVGVKNAPRDTVSVRRLPSTRTTELRAALRAAREGDGEGVLFELDRGYGPRARAAARVTVGVAPVLVLVGLVGAVVAPSAAGLFILLLVLLPGLVGGVVWALSRTHDTGVRVTGDGMLRAEGWSGVREFRLSDYPRVTVKERTGSDMDFPIEM